MGGEVTAEVKEQDGMFVPLSNYRINAMKKYQLYADIFQRGIKENKSTVNNYLKYLLRVEIQNRVSNVTVVESNKNDLSYFPETATCRALRPIEIHVVDVENQLFSIFYISKFSHN